VRASVLPGRREYLLCRGSTTSLSSEASLRTRPAAAPDTPLGVGTTLLRLDGLTLDRGGTRLLDDVDVELREGDVALCTGPNGSGKTTLLRVLAGLLRPSRGTRTAHGDRLELLGHTTALHPDLTLLENLAVIARLVDAPPGAAAAALQHVGLGGAADRRAARCSAGMRRRAEFARLRLTRPRILLLDEPDVALDETAQALVRDAITTTAQAGGATVVATHAPQRLLGEATRRWTVRDGRVTT
jgi:heme ABC exporter ATP-binding subunit CcmA